MRKLAILLLVLVACSGDSPTEQSVGPDTGEVRISGTVRDYRSGAGISSAKVRFRSTETITDSYGHYAMTVERDRDPIHVNGVLAGEVSALRSRTDVDLLVNGGSCRAWYGTVVEAFTGTPVAGAQIQLGGRQAETDDAGTYRFDLGCDANNGSTADVLAVKRRGYTDTSWRYSFESPAPLQRHDLELMRD